MPLMVGILYIQNLRTLLICISGRLGSLYIHTPFIRALACLILSLLQLGVITIGSFSLLFISSVFKFVNKFHKAFKFLAPLRDSQPPAKLTNIYIVVVAEGVCMMCAFHCVVDIMLQVLSGIFRQGFV